MNRKRCTTCWQWIGSQEELVKLRRKFKHQVNEIHKVLEARTRALREAQQRAAEQQAELERQKNQTWPHGLKLPHCSIHRQNVADCPACVQMLGGGFKETQCPNHIKI